MQQSPTPPARPKRVLWALESPARPTGYGRVARELLPRVAARDHHHSHGLLAWSHLDSGCEFDAAGYELMTPAEHGAPRAASWNADSLETALQEFQPDVLLTVGNLRMVECAREIKSRKLVEWVSYFPVEGAPLPSWRLDELKSMDGKVTFSEFGRQTIESAFPGDTCESIPLGVDANSFRPLRNRRRLREELGLADGFVVGCVARNQPRKQLPVLLEAFARLVDCCPDSVLYLHANPFDVGWDLTALAEHYGIADRTLFTDGLADGRRVEDDELNAIYNLFDVFVLPTGAEGFGLPILESMAAGVPVVVTNYGAAAELAQGRGVLVEPATYLTDESSHTELALLDSETLADVLCQLHDDDERLRRCAKSGRAFARRCSWERCADRWAEHLKPQTFN